MSVTGLSPAANLTLTAVRALTTQWQQGQLLQATVGHRLPGGDYLIRIGNTQLQAQSNLQLQDGQQLTLRVSKAGRLPVLKLLNTVADAQLLRSRLLRQSLPVQAALPPLLANIKWAANQTSTTAPLPPNVTQAASRLLAGLVSPAQIATADGLRQALLNSGPLLEARLRAMLTNRKLRPPTADLKTGLLRLALALGTGKSLPAAGSRSPSSAGTGTASHPPAPGTALQTSPPAAASLAGEHDQATARQILRHQVDSGLARIQVGQSWAVPVAEQSAPVWMFELPVRHGDDIDLFHLQIEQNPESRQQQDKEARLSWVATLSFEFADTGAFHAQLVLRDGRLSTHLWAENDATAKRMARQLPELQQRLQKAGLTIASLQSWTGRPASSSRKPATSLLDLRA